jgi:hypothetical protein
MPSGNATWSPRIGFNWDVDGSGMTIVRGGVGYFGGRPAYVWMSNAYVNTGMAQTQLTCRNDNASALDDVPAFNLDPSLQPSRAAPGKADSDHQLLTRLCPKRNEAVLGIDHRSLGHRRHHRPLHTKTEPLIQDNNLAGVVHDSLTYATGEGNRRATAPTRPRLRATPRKRTAAFGNVLEHRTSPRTTPSPAPSSCRSGSRTASSSTAATRTAKPRT